VPWGSFDWSSFTSPTLVYFTLDHLGSISVVTDAAAHVLERDSYDAWGKRRNPDGTAASCGAIASNTTRRNGVSVDLSGRLVGEPGDMIYPPRKSEWCVTEYAKAVSVA
jgi:hypothetical protein